MLYIRRKAGESFYIENQYNERITVKIMNLYNDCITLGIDAPDDFHIARDNMKKGKEIKGGNK